ncbi:Uncharacterised protein [Amycolatopsis camponoti]|uniref:CsbD family protein n=2 Tax=Pseudonocardiaceae TaxID=2070 RepID=A0A6I8M0D1_9PSEU|nr:Uncharacterised protein [Amycolatopsis camponoti]
MDMTMKDKVQQAVGGARSKLGAATGNRRLEASGRVQRRRAQVAEVAHDLRDRFRDAQARRRSPRPGDPS